MSTRRRWACASTLLLGLTLAHTPPMALAWDPATTHSGLTGRAVSASKLHAVLAQRLGRPLGLFEPLRLDVSVLDADTARLLRSRLDRLDAAAGYRPSAEGVAMADAWVRAGAVLEKTPPERARNHFLDPRQGLGLHDNPGLSGALHAARLAFEDDATVRQAATGQAFDLEGMSALAWLEDPDNDLGLRAFVEHWERAVIAPRPPEREAELVRALLALGGTLSVLEDMGQPAFVRNDVRREFLAPSDGSPFERFVAARYGAVGLPPPGSPPVRANVESYFLAGDGQGLAQRTQGAFFSAGTLPEDVRMAPGEPSSDLIDMINRSLAFPAPAVTALDTAQPGRTHHLRLDGARILAYRRDDNRIHFFLDDAVYGDCARRWLPLVEAYAVGLVDHLLRASLEVAVADGRATVRMAGLKGELAADAQVIVLAEDAAGTRKELGRAPAGALGAAFAIPTGTKKVAAVLRGRDAGGAMVAASEVGVP